MSQMVRDKFISLFERRPDLLSEWHPAKNGDIRPEDISFGSGRKIWWQCSQGHEWQAFPYRRSEGSGCPYCANQKVLTGYNDMATTHPELLCDWDYELNDDSPNSIIAGSNKKFHWKCATCGHQWVASANARTRSGCRECGKAQLGQLVHLSALRKTGSLTITHPHLLAEWNSIKNGTLMPTDVTAGSHKKVWWICDAGHDFYTSVYERVHSNGCPICSNRQVLSGYNDLESQYPAITQEWDYGLFKI